MKLSFSKHDTRPLYLTKKTTRMMKAPALKIVTTYDNLVVLSDLLQDYDDSDFQTDSPQNQKETELENASAPHTPLSPDHEASFDDVDQQALQHLKREHQEVLEKTRRNSDDLHVEMTLLNSSISGRSASIDGTSSKTQNSETRRDTLNGSQSESLPVETSLAVDEPKTESESASSTVDKLASVAESSTLITLLRRINPSVKCRMPLGMLGDNFFLLIILRHRKY